jgi:hypothetical protein
MRRMRMKKLALLLSLLALSALGLVACGGGHDEDSATAAKVSADTTTEATGPPATTPEAKLSREQVHRLKREANTWASLFADRACNRYMGQPMCERLKCVREVVTPIKNCTPVSAAFRKSFADATVEDIKRIVLVDYWTDRPLYEAAVNFSNGEVVVFVDVPPGGCPGGPCSWGIADLDRNNRFLAAAAPRE